MAGIMKKFEILEHKADLKIRVFGENKEELFLNAVLAMSEIVASESSGEQFSASWRRTVLCKSQDLASLLVDFLSEVLYLIQTQREVYSDVKFKKFSDTEIEAELIGQKVERFGEDIKAVTYHNLDVHQKKDGSWEATVLFDI